MRKAAHWLAALSIPLALSLPGRATAGDDLVDVIPDLVPPALIIEAGTATTVRPDEEGDPVTDTGPAFAVYTDSVLIPEFGALSGRLFEESRNLPRNSGVAAFTYEFDPQRNAYVPSQQGLGPIFADRAQTIGQGRFNVGVAWSHIDFDEVGGTNLNDIPVQAEPTQVAAQTFSQFRRGLGPVVEDGSAVLAQLAPGDTSVSFTLPDDDVLGRGCTRLDTAARMSGGFPALCLALPPEGDVILADGPSGQFTTTSQLDPIPLNLHFEVDLIQLHATYGLTDTIDLGILLPILEVDIDAQLKFRTFDFTDPRFADDFDFILDPAGNGSVPPLCEPASDPTCQLLALQFEAGDAVKGAIDQAAMESPPFSSASDPAQAVAATLAAVEVFERLENGGTSQGVGDLELRAKWRFLETPVMDAAGRLDVSFPTGDEDDFRGDGEYMGGFNLILSKAFGWLSPHANLGLQIRTGSRENHQFRWAIGADARLHARLAASADFVGSEDLYHDGVADSRQSIALGLKVNPWRGLVVSGSALIRVNHQGLRADVIPSLNVEYTFN